MFPPERIICLTEETVETLYLLGEESRIVGTSGDVVRPPRARREGLCLHLSRYPEDRRPACPRRIEIRKKRMLANPYYRPAVSPKYRR